MPAASQPHEYIPRRMFTGISLMRAVRLDGPPPRVIPRRIGIAPMTPLKEIPVHVTPGVAKDPRRDRTRPLPSPGLQA